MSAAGAKDENKTLADLNPNLNKEQAMREVLAEIAASDPANAQLLKELSNKDSVIARRVALSVRSIQAAIQANLRQAEEEGLKATVATDNTQALWELLTRLVGFVKARRIFRQAGISRDLNRLIAHGRVYITLEQFNQVMEAFWLGVGTKDAPFLAAAYLVENGFGPLRQVMPSAQETLPMRSLYSQAPFVSWLFNKVKKMKKGRSGRNFCEFTSTIDAAIPPIRDYWSRFFVHAIVAGVLTGKVLAYLKRYTGLTAGDLREAVAVARRGEKPNWQQPAPGISGAAVTEGLYRYWWSQNPELTWKYNLPRKLTADLREIWLQFPLQEALEFHLELAQNLGFNSGFENVLEREGVLLVTVDGQEVPVAHRVKLLKRRKSYDWRELKAGESWLNEPFHVDHTLPWCYSEEYGRAINICEGPERDGNGGFHQLWNMPTTFWRLTWNNPYVPINVLFEQLTKLGVTNLRHGGAALAGISRSIWERHKATQAALATAKAEHQEMQTQVSALTRQIVQVLLVGEAAYADWMRNVEQLFQEKLDKVSKGHIQRVQDLGSIRLARAANFTPTDFHGLISNEPSEAEVIRYATDEHYRKTRNAVQLYRVAAKIHDYGKMIVPERDLNFPGKPDPARGRRIQMHVGFTGLIGEALYVADHPEAVRIASRHHEHLDHSGYLEKLGTADLDYLDRQLAVDDRYDAMRGPRPYREPQSMPRLQIFQIVRRDAGLKLDGWHVAHIFETAGWLRDHLAPLPGPVLKSYGLSDEMVLYLHEIEINRETADQEDQIVAELKARFPHPDPLAPPPWEL